MPFDSLLFGTCPCGGRYEARAVEVRLPVGGEQVVHRNVEQGLCPNCGSRVYEAGVIEELETLFAERRFRPFESPA